MCGATGDVALAKRGRSNMRVLPELNNRARYAELCNPLEYV